MGKAGKFNLVQLLLTSGACLGLLSISSLIAEFLMISCCIRKKPKKTLPVIQNEVRKVSSKFYKF